MELQIVYFLNHLGRGTFVDGLTFYVSWIPFLVAFWLLLALAALIFAQKNGPWLFWGSIIIVLIYFILNDLLLKQTLASIFFRERPYLAYPNTIISSGEMWLDSSFPSGHMSITVALLTLYLYFYRKLLVWLLAGLFVLLMAFARLHNGMHYPTDVLAGTILGIGYGLLAIFLVKKIRQSQK